MASPATTASRVLFAVLLVAVTAELAGAANVLVVNNCPFTLWPAVIAPQLGGGGTQLNPGQTWLVQVPAGTSGARIWARTGCVFAGNRGRCMTGDCAGSLSCKVPGTPPATLAEFTVGKDEGALDYYDVSVVDGFNVPMDFSSSTGGGMGTIRCRGAGSGCADGSHAGGPKIHQCRGNSDYQVVFCP